MAFASSSSSASFSSSTGSQETQTCIRDKDPCHWNGSLGYCCSGHCEQVAPQPFGKCAVTLSTTTSSTRSSTFSTSTASSCLREGERCRGDGSMGTCCSFICNQMEGEPYGYCRGSSPPTGLPPKCLAGGADCSPDGSLGICCGGICDAIAPHPIGTCRFTKEELDAQKSGGGSSNNWIIGTCVALVVVGLICVALGWLYRRQRKMEKALSQNERNHFFNGDPEHAQLNGYAHENVDNLPYDKDKWEINESDFTIDWSSVLGSGNFGMVLKGKVKGNEVAVKTVRNNAIDGSHLRSLLSEIKVLQYLGTNENLVNMVGSNTSCLTTGKVYLFLEYCPLGSLEKYLRKNKLIFQQNLGTEKEVDGNVYMNTTNLQEDLSLTTGDMINWCQQITNAMRYLESKKVIHADLATRNVLLLKKDCVKLTDFGLSRRLYEYSSYVKRHQEPLPWRHMAIEALQNLCFTHKSDVWSLGITFWEIFSLGDVPYPGLSWTQEFVSYLENNLRPAKPKTATHELYDIMLDCWKPIPDTRPNFDYIYKRLLNYQEAQNMQK